MPEQVKEQYIGDRNAISIEPMRKIEVDGFYLTAFEVPHDKDVVCYAYIIEHEDFGKLLYMTDCMYCKYNLQSQKINHFLIECNYSKDLVDENYERSLRNRVLSTHMELQTVKNFVEANKSSALRTVILCHASTSNLNCDIAIEQIKEVVGNNVNVKFAAAGEAYPLDLYPF